MIMDIKYYPTTIVSVSYTDFFTSTESINFGVS